MLLYCPDCKRLYTEEEKCPVCGKRKGREPQADDPCFLMSVGTIWTEMVSDLLKQNEIPFEQKSSQGAAIAMLTGLLSETFDYYVAFDRYGEAKELTDAFFTQNAENEAEEAESEETEEESEEE
ncbi:MAG: hypothetical protein IKH57_17480 [Clostridia bacterium]|nr:hypothetical protein [Clostridia bacterium]